METSAQFAEVFLSKVVRCWNAYSEKETMRVFFDSVPANVQSAVRMSWGGEHDACLSKPAQLKDTLLEQTTQMPR